MLRYSKVSAVLSAIHTSLSSLGVTAKSNYDTKLKTASITIDFDSVVRNDKDLISVSATVYFDKIMPTEEFGTLVANTEIAFSKNGLIPDIYTFEKGNLIISFVPRFDLTI